MSNAFTGMDQTNYFFDVAPEHLEPALDRFAQFFIAPLFDASCTEREANAVHSENSKNLQSDMWRFFQLDKSTSSRKHAFWRFGTGNRVTLWDEPQAKGIDVRQRLIEWSEKYYSANTCKLAVISKGAWAVPLPLLVPPRRLTRGPLCTADTLDATTAMVVSQFAAVSNRHITPPEFPGSPLTSDELGRTVFVKSVKDARILELTFPFPDESDLYASKPGSFISHLIGHEGAGSVLSYLKEKGWANGMSAGAGNGAAGFEFFKIQVDLTQEGLGELGLAARHPPSFSRSLTRDTCPLSTLRGRLGRHLRLHCPPPREPSRRMGLPRSRSTLSPRIPVQGAIPSLFDRLTSRNDALEALPARQGPLGAVGLHRVVPGQDDRDARVDAARELPHLFGDAERGRRQDLRPPRGVVRHGIYY